MAKKPKRPKKPAPAGGEAAEGRASSERKRGSSGIGSQEEHRSSAGEWARALGWAVVIFLIVRTFILQTFVITSGSMEDSLLVGDFLAVNRTAYGSRIPFTDIRTPALSEPRLGDIVVFDPPHEEGIMLVKRLVGMPGDTMEMRGGVLYRNGEPQEEPYVIRDGSPDVSAPQMDWQQQYLVGENGSRLEPRYRPTRDNWGPIEIPEGNYFMLGDNRDASQDSRYWGLLERWRFVGRVWRIYYSYDKESLRAFSFFREVRWGRIFDRVR